MAFDKSKDKIAITVPEFSILKKTDGPFQKYVEPYILSLAVDASGKADPKIDFNFMPFPKVAKGGTVTMLGDGHLVYGPKNPGEFVAISILVMESDKDVQDLGATLEKVVTSKAADLGIKAILLANPGAATVIGILKELTQLVAGFLKNNKDDELFRTEGSFLQDHVVPYHINRSYSLGNEFANISVNIVPLKSANGQGAVPESLELK